MENFRKLGISEPVLKIINDEKFERPSEIQEKSIPLILAGNDVMAMSATGSGKTLAFAAGILKNSEKRREIQALILVPTRELAEQVSEAFKKFSGYRPLKITAIYGGVGISPQIQGLKNADVVVATPGRLLDHIGRGTINLGAVETLVLDEADRMFDMGFKTDVEKIIKKCPGERQTLMFSATLSQDVVKIARNHMKRPVKVSAGQHIDPGKLDQVYYNVADDMKFSLLVHLLKEENSGLVMVFSNTKRNTDKVAKNLRHSGIDAMAIHGGLTQSKRTSVMSLFNTKESCVLVCTDVAARGLDIPGVSHVYNYDIPRESQQYIHRIGRTARAGAEGKAINILSSHDYDNFSKVLKETKIKIKEKKAPTIKKVAMKNSQKGTNRPAFRRGWQSSRPKQH